MCLLHRMFVCAITHVKLMYCTLMCVCLAVRVGWNLCILPKGLFLWWIIIICCEYKHTYTFSFRLIWIDAIDYYDIPRTIVKTSETIVKVTNVKCPDNDKTHTFLNVSEEDIFMNENWINHFKAGDIKLAYWSHKMLIANELFTEAALL